MNLDITKEQIDAQHRKSGLLGIGFHFVITIDGDVKKGRDIDQIGFNLDDDNGETVGIALVGDTKFNELQTKSLKNLIQDLNKKYGLLKIKTTLKDLL
ncbi:N-acetylmuramoyl-L-alanine amidase [Pelagibacter phage HTVC200P]|nr:N-acetylmuramoyl-L-alanine amidase [Pelagibacter phage HTVC200P]